MWSLSQHIKIITSPEAQRTGNRESLTCSFVLGPRILWEKKKKKRKTREGQNVLNPSKTAPSVVQVGTAPEEHSFHLVFWAQIFGDIKENEKKYVNLSETKNVNILPWSITPITRLIFGKLMRINYLSIRLI